MKELWGVNATIEYEAVHSLRPAPPLQRLVDKILNAVTLQLDKFGSEALYVSFHLRIEQDWSTFIHTKFSPTNDGYVNASRIAQIVSEVYGLAPNGVTSRPLVLYFATGAARSDFEQFFSWQGATLLTKKKFLLRKRGN